MLPFKIYLIHINESSILFWLTTTISFLYKFPIWWHLLEISEKFWDLAIPAWSADNCRSNRWVEGKDLFLLITSWQPLRRGYMTSEWLASRFQFSARLLGRLSLLVKCTDSITEALPLDKLKYRSGHANYKFDVVLISTTSPPYARLSEN